MILIGPKGSGKSHIGRVLEAGAGVHFFHVEPHWLRYHQACARAGRAARIGEGIARVRPFLERALREHEKVCIETTGASAEILDDLLTLRDRVAVRLIKVEAPLALCLERIAARDPTDQIPLDEGTIQKVYALSREVDLAFDLTLENVALSDHEILQAFDRIGAGPR